MTLYRVAGLLALIASVGLGQEIPDWGAIATEIAGQLEPPREVRWEAADLEASAGVVHARGARFALSGELEILYQRFPLARWADEQTSLLKCNKPTIVQIRGSDLVIVRGAEVAQQAAGVRALNAVWAAVGNASATHKIMLRPQGRETTQRATYATEACMRSFQSLFGKLGYIERQEPLRERGIWRERATDVTVRSAQGASKDAMEAMKAYVQAILDASPARTPDMPLGATPGIAETLTLDWRPERSARGNFVIQLSGIPKGYFARRILFSRNGSSARAERLDVTNDEPLRLKPLPAGEWVIRLRVEGRKDFYFRQTVTQATDGQPKTVVFRWADRTFRPALE